MGTRGSVGFRADQQDFLTYNHFDSYPDGLGADTVKFVQTYPGTLENMREKVKALRPVKAQDTPSHEEWAQYKHLWQEVSTGSDWYSLLRSLQGDLDATLEAGIMITENTFVHNSLFCEWAYIINVDTLELEVYEGFNKDPKADGRYAQFGDRDEYAGVRLLACYPLDQIKTMAVEDWVADVNRRSEKLAA